MNTNRKVAMDNSELKRNIIEILNKTDDSVLLKRFYLILIGSTTQGHGLR